MSDLPEDDVLFVHEPVRAVREDVISEVVFVRRWQALQDSDDKPDDLDGRNSILRDILALTRHETTQRDATVCASFMRWLGTNNGQGFLHAAERMVARMGGDHKRGFVAAWAIENMRDSQWNLGVNSIEDALADDHSTLTGKKVFADLKISGEDIDAVNMLVQWIGCDRGKSFLGGCNTEISAIRREDRLRRMAEDQQQREASPT